MFISILIQKYTVVDICNYGILYSNYIRVKMSAILPTSTYIKSTLYNIKAIRKKNHLTNSRRVGLTQNTFKL